MIKVFSSGSCRLLTGVGKGHKLIEPLHSMFFNFVGINFLGKLHDIKCHIQFIKYIKGEIHIPDDILPYFLVSYSRKKQLLRKLENHDLLPSKLNNLRESFDNCSIYLFEISSLKLFFKNGFSIMSEIAEQYNSFEKQTKEDLKKDIRILINLIGNDKKIVFQCHFRPNIIENDDKLKIENREIIYEAINEIQSEYENVFLHDPSIFIRENHLSETNLFFDDFDKVKPNQPMYDGKNHFSRQGAGFNLRYIMKNIIKL